MPRVGINYRLGEESVVRFGYARYLMPAQAMRDTLGAFVDSYAGFAQTTNTLGLANGVPRQVLANPYPAALNPVIEPYGQSYGRYTNLGGLVGSTTTAPSGLDQYNQKPQINDRINLSYQHRIWGGVITDFSYFYQPREPGAVPHRPEHDGPGLPVRAEDAC